MSLEECFVVAVDGPAASGKGTVASRLADILKGHHLDTGSLYRVLAYNVIKEKLDAEDVQGIVHLIGKIDFNLNDHVIRTPEVSNMASKIAVHQPVRDKLNQLQLDYPKNKKLVVIEGRDIGTVIFPNADCKLYITASVEIRAKRRHKQQSVNNSALTYGTVLQDLKERDLRDGSRKNAPMAIADDAIVIETGDMSIEDVVNCAYQYVLERKG